MKIERTWQHDETTEELGDAIVNALDTDNDLEVIPNSDEGGSIEIRFEGRLFELRLLEVV